MNLPVTMNAMIMDGPRRPLVLRKVPLPVPAAHHVLVKITACGVCRTDLHIIDGDLPHPKPSLIPGHEIIGEIVQKGSSVTQVAVGDWIGIPWLGYTCGDCIYCKKGQENLCIRAAFTGYTIDGGFAEFTVAHEQYCFPIQQSFANPSGAPLMCAGLIGYRSYSLIRGDNSRIGIYGFGAAAHILIQIALGEGKKIYAFTRDGDLASQAFARRLGASWAGDSSTDCPVKLDAAIIFAPVGSLIPKALRDLDKAGTVVCAGIHMSEIPAFPYSLLWEERVVRSVANLTRKDGSEFLKLAAQLSVKTDTRLFALENANEAIDQLRRGMVEGAAVLVMK